MLKFILIGLAVIIVVLAVVVAMQPDDFRVTRSTTMSAPRSHGIRPQVNDLHKWEAWNPWPEKGSSHEAGFRRTARRSRCVLFVGGQQRGREGRLTIAESRPGELVRLKLEFMKPVCRPPARPISPSSPKATRRP